MLKEGLHPHGHRAEPSGKVKTRWSAQATRSAPRARVAGKGVLSTHSSCADRAHRRGQDPAGGAHGRRLRDRIRGARSFSPQLQGRVRADASGPPDSGKRAVRQLRPCAAAGLPDFPPRLPGATSVAVPDRVGWLGFPPGSHRWPLKPRLLRRRLAFAPHPAPLEAHAPCLASHPPHGVACRDFGRACFHLLRPCPAVSHWPGRRQLCAELRQLPRRQSPRRIRAIHA